MPKKFLAGLGLAFIVLSLIRLWPHPPLSSYAPSSTAVLAADGSLLRLTLAADQQYRLWVPLKDISPTLVDAVKLQEDQWFYWHAGINPLALLRGYLGTRGFMAADRLNLFPDGRLARACGIVTVRQRPGTAHGTVFVTLEDETGPVNVIVWPSLVDTQRKELLGSSLLGVYGIWQSHQGVRSLVAKRLVDLSGLLGKLNTESRNFH